MVLGHLKVASSASSDDTVTSNGSKGDGEVDQEQDSDEDGNGNMPSRVAQELHDEKVRDMMVWWARRNGQEYLSAEALRSLR